MGCVLEGVGRGGDGFRGGREHGAWQKNGEWRERCGEARGMRERERESMTEEE